MPADKRLIAALEELRDRLMSMQPEADDLKPELRRPFRAGFAQCRSVYQAYLTEIIGNLEK